MPVEVVAEQQELQDASSSFGLVAEWEPGELLASLAPEVVKLDAVVHKEVVAGQAADKMEAKTQLSNHAHNIYRK